MNAIRQIVRQTLRESQARAYTNDRIEQIKRLQATLEQMPAEAHRECPVNHHFAPGTYAREMFAPFDTIVVGKTHRHDHLCFVTAGDILVADENGVRRITAPAILHSKAGTKRVGYTLADTIWITVHATSETDLEKLEAELIVPEVPLIEEKAA